MGCLRIIYNTELKLIRGRDRMLPREEKSCRTEAKSGAGTGLYYYGARYYDPRISVWLSVDPLAEQTMTPYQYVNQNPIILIDPTGMKGEDWYRGLDADGNTVYKEINSAAKTIKDKETGNTFENVGKTLKDVFRGLGIEDKKHRTEDYSVKVQGGSDGGGNRAQVPNASQEGILQVNVFYTPDLEVDSEGNKYFKDISTNINVTYYVNNGRANKGVIYWATVKEIGASRGQAKILNRNMARHQIYEGIYNHSAVGFESIRFSNDAANYTPANQSNSSRFIKFNVRAGYTNAKKASSVSLNITP